MFKKLSILLLFNLFSTALFGANNANNQLAMAALKSPKSPKNNIPDNSIKLSTKMLKEPAIKKEESEETGSEKPVNLSIEKTNQTIEPADTFSIDKSIAQDEKLVDAQTKELQEIAQKFFENNTNPALIKQTLTYIATLQPLKVLDSEATLEALIEICSKLPDSYKKNDPSPSLYGTLLKNIIALHLINKKQNDNKTNIHKFNTSIKQIYKNLTAQQKRDVKTDTYGLANDYSDSEEITEEGNVTDFTDVKKKIMRRSKESEFTNIEKKQTTQKQIDAHKTELCALEPEIAIKHAELNQLYDQQTKNLQEQQRMQEEYKLQNFAQGHLQSKQVNTIKSLEKLNDDLKENLQKIKKNIDAMNEEYKTATKDARITLVASVERETQLAQKLEKEIQEVTTTLEYAKQKKDALTQTWTGLARKLNPFSSN